MENVGIRVYVNDDPNKNYLASVSLNIAGKFLVYGIMVRNGKYGPYATMPSRKVQDVWKPIVSVEGAEFAKAFQSEIMTCYYEAKKSESKSFIRDCVPSELNYAIGINLVNGDLWKKADVTVKLLDHIYIDGAEVRFRPEEDREYVTFPGFKKADGSYGETAAPFTSEFREEMKNSILESYHQAKEMESKPTEI